MATIRRYGPGQLTSGVAPRPELGNGAAQGFAQVGKLLEGANKFLRPAVEQHMQAKGEAEALAAIDEGGAEFEMVEREGAGRRNSGPPTVDNAVSSTVTAAANRYGVPPAALLVTMQLESGGNGSAQNPNSSASGWFQFTDATAQQYGLADRTDLSASSDAAARLARDNMTSLSNALGRAPTAGEIYLAHQQGAGGAIALLRDPSRPAIDALTEAYRGDRARAEEALTLNGGSLDMTAGEFAGKWTRRAGDAVAHVDNAAEMELRRTNENSFEPRLPFTVRNAAFNASAGRVIEARATEAMTSGIAAAMVTANGDMAVLNREIERVRATVMGGLPPEMPGLRTSLEAQLERASGAAARSAIETMQRRTVARQAEAVSTIATSFASEAERLAISGATQEELTAHTMQAQHALAAYGPREAFTVNGQTYPADPGRAGIISAADVGAQITAIGESSAEYMLRSGFANSQAPAQFAAEFREQVMSGNSPLPVGQSLQLLGQFEAQARAYESARATAANAERKRLEEETADRINAYVSLTDAGVPVAIPAAEREAILSNLAAHPDLQREALEKFAVADAAVQTFNLSGPELLSYVEGQRAAIRSSLERGEINFEAVAVVNSLEDRLKKLADAVDSEQLGLSAIEQLIRDGANIEAVDYDQLRTQAAGNPELLEEIAEVQAFHVSVEAMRNLSGGERGQVLADLRGHIGRLAAMGRGLGSEALRTANVMDALAAWSEGRASLAESDPMAFARSVGVAMPGFENVNGIADAADVLAERINLISPRTMSEGVDYPVPLEAHELTALTDIFANASITDRMAFIGEIAGLGAGQAEAVFAALGDANPSLYAAGMVYSGGNPGAAELIIRGSSSDINIQGGTVAEVNRARADVLGDIMKQNFIDGESLQRVDEAAMAYARGKALSAGGRAITYRDLADGYQAALGRHQDGTGGVVDTDYGTTILPGGWTARDFNRAMRNLTNEQLETMVWDALARSTDGEFTGGHAHVMGANGEIIFPIELTRSIGHLMPTDDPNVFFPLDRNGGFFLTRTTPPYQFSINIERLR